LKFHFFEQELAGKEEKIFPEKIFKRQNTNYLNP